MSAADGCTAFLLGIAAFVAVLCLSALVAMFAWNLGVVALVAACGGAATTIGFKTAFWGVVALMFLRPRVGGASKVVNKSQ